MTGPGCGIQPSSPYLKAIFLEIPDVSEMGCRGLNHVQQECQSRGPRAACCHFFMFYAVRISYRTIYVRPKCHVSNACQIATCVPLFYTSIK
jgi:hypothetical protein